MLTWAGNPRAEGGSGSRSLRAVLIAAPHLPTPAAVPETGSGEGKGWEGWRPRQRQAMISLPVLGPFSSLVAYTRGSGLFSFPQGQKWDHFLWGSLDPLKLCVRHQWTVPGLSLRPWRCALHSPLSPAPPTHTLPPPAFGQEACSPLPCSPAVLLTPGMAGSVHTWTI